MTRRTCKAFLTLLHSSTHECSGDTKGERQRGLAADGIMVQGPHAIGCTNRMFLQSQIKSAVQNAPQTNQCYNPSMLCEAVEL